MKKAFILVIVFISLIFSFTCNASVITSYYIPEIGTEIKLDENKFDLIYYDKSLTKNNSELDLEEDFQMSEKEYINIIEGKNICFDALNVYDGNELFIKVLEDENSKEFYDLNNFTEDEIFNDLFRTDYLSDISNSLGLSYLDAKPETINDTVYISIAGEKDNVSIAAYCTIKNGRNIIISLNNFYSDTFAEYSQILYELAASIEYPDIEDVSYNSPYFMALSDQLSSITLKALGGALSGLIMAIIATLIYKRRKKKMKKYNESLFQESEESTSGPIQRDKLLDEAGAPIGVTIGEDNYPSQIINGVDVYKVKAFKGDTYFHRPDCKHAENKVYKIYNFVYIWHHPDFGRVPCPYCKPYFPDCDWYDEYQKKVKKRNKLKNTDLIDHNTSAYSPTLANQIENNKSIALYEKTDEPAISIDNKSDLAKSNMPISNEVLQKKLKKDKKSQERKKHKKTIKKYRVAIICLSIFLVVSICVNIFLAFSSYRLYQKNIDIEDSLNSKEIYIQKLENGINYSIDYVQENYPGWKTDLIFLPEIKNYLE